MNNVFKHPKSLMLAGLFVVVITAAAWQADDKDKKDSSASKHQAGDTTVPKQSDHYKDEFRIKDLDKAMKELDTEMKHLDVHLKDMHLEIEKSIREAFAELDLDNIHEEVATVIKNIDFDNIRKEISESLKQVDLNKINLDVEKSLKEAQEEIKKIDMQKMHTEMKELQLKLNDGELKTQIESAMKDAKKEIEKAKKELQDLRDFTDALQKDGLIDKQKGFSLEWTKDGDLIINGKTQPKEIADKYSRYYKKEGYKLKIRSEDNGNLRIDDL